MRTPLNILPDTYYPESYISEHNSLVEYRICLHSEGIFSYLPGVYGNPRTALMINPLLNYSNEITTSSLFKPNFVIIEINTSDFKPIIIYFWNQDHWRKVENVRTNNS